MTRRKHTQTHNSVAQARVDLSPIPPSSVTAGSGGANRPALPFGVTSLHPRSPTLAAPFGCIPDSSVYEVDSPNYCNNFCAPGLCCALGLSSKHGKITMQRKLALKQHWVLPGVFSSNSFRPPKSFSGVFPSAKPTFASRCEVRELFGQPPGPRGYRKRLRLRDKSNITQTQHHQKA